MRWPTLVISVALFCSLSVNAFPHDVDEKRHWLHRREGGPDSSTSSDPHPTASGDPTPTGVSTPPDTPTPAPSPSSSSSSTPELPPSTPSPSSDSSTVTSPSSSSSSSSSSSPTNPRSNTSTPPPSTATNGPDPNKDTTSYHRFSTPSGLPSDTTTTGGTGETGTGSGSSFLQNKAAMGSTFAIVGLIGAAIVVGAAFFLIKKVRKRRDEDELDTYFEKLPVRGNNANNASRSVGGDYGLGPSGTDLTSPASDQAYMPRDVHYGATSQYPDQYPNYGGLEYPPDRESVVERPVSFAPGTAYAAAMSQRGQYNYGGPVEDPNAVPNHPFADPDNRRY